MSEERGGAGAPVLVLRKFRQILESFTIERPEQTLQQITRATGLPASTCQRLGQNLVREAIAGNLDLAGTRTSTGSASAWCSGPRRAHSAWTSSG